MGFFVLSFVFAALAGTASLAHVQLKYRHLCALANVKPASARTVERSMVQSRTISAAMKAMTFKLMISYNQLVDNLVFLTVGADTILYSPTILLGEVGKLINYKTSSLDVDVIKTCSLISLLVN